MECQLEKNFLCGLEIFASVVREAPGILPSTPQQHFGQDLWGVSGDPFTKPPTSMRGFRGPLHQTPTSMRGFRGPLTIPSTSMRCFSNGVIMRSPNIKDGFRGPLNLASVMPRDGSVSDVWNPFAVTPLVRQLCHFHSSYTSCASVTPVFIKDNKLFKVRFLAQAFAN